MIRDIRYCRRTPLGGGSPPVYVVVASQTSPTCPLGFDLLASFVHPSMDGKWY